MPAKAGIQAVFTTNSPLPNPLPQAGEGAIGVAGRRITVGGLFTQILLIKNIIFPLKTPTIIIK
jgi:hypothetical protein